MRKKYILEEHFAIFRNIEKYIFCEVVKLVHAFGIPCGTGGHILQRKRNKVFTRPCLWGKPSSSLLLRGWKAWNSKIPILKKWHRLERICQNICCSNIDLIPQKNSRSSRLNGTFLWKNDSAHKIWFNHTISLLLECGNPQSKLFEITICLLGRFPNIKTN